MRIKKKKLSLVYRLKRDIYFSLIRFIRFFQSIFLKKRNNKFLFILSPPYCGSTLLNQLLSTSKNVSCNNHINDNFGRKMTEMCVYPIYGSFLKSTVVHEISENSRFLHQTSNDDNL